MAPRSAKQFEELRADKKDIIVQAALHVFSEQGYHNSSISTVSAEAGISKGLMYNYFKSKEELLQTLLESLIDHEVKTIELLLNKPISVETMTEFVKLNTKLLKAKPKTWKLYFNMASQPEVTKIIRSRYIDIQILYGKKLLHFFKLNGEDDPLVSLAYFNTVFTGFKISYINNPHGYPIEKMEELMIKQFISK